MGLLSGFAQSSGSDHLPRPRTSAILIVEDEPLVAFDNEHALSHAGYTVVGTVDRYTHAVAAMEEGGIDLVIADIRLPGKRDGVDVARHAQRRGIPLLFATAHCPAEAHPLALGWLAKPFGSRDLVRAVAVCDALLAGTRPRLVPPAMSVFSAQTLP